MIRVVVDTNVFVSALLSNRGALAELLDAFLGGGYEIVSCPALLDELEDVLGRRRFRRWVEPGEAEAFVGAIRRASIVVRDPARPARRSRDPDDDLILALAVAEGADLIVTGDRDLLDLEGTGIPILDPRAFLDALG